MTRRAQEQRSNESNATRRSVRARGSRRQRRKGARVRLDGASHSTEPPRVSDVTELAGPVSGVTDVPDPDPATPASSVEPRADEASDTTDELADFERAFFDSAVSSWVSQPEPWLDDEPEENPLLSPEHLRRRLWFRRQVTRLMAGLGAFSVVVVVMRLTGWP